MLRLVGKHIGLVYNLKDEENELDKSALADFHGEDEYGEAQAVSEDSGNEDERHD